MYQLLYILITEYRYTIYMHAMQLFNNMHILSRHGGHKFMFINWLFPS